MELRTGQAVNDGYPRYDWMLHPSMSKDEILDSLFGWKGKSCSVDADFQKK